jgi:hypothetical protein
MSNLRFEIAMRGEQRQVKGQGNKANVPELIEDIHLVG